MEEGAASVGHTDVEPEVDEAEIDGVESKVQLVLSMLPAVPHRRKRSLHNFIELLVEDSMDLSSAVLHCTQSADSDKAAAAMVTLHQFVGDTHKMIHRAIRDEVQRTMDPNTLFRGNSIASKLMSHFARSIGTQYLVGTLRRGVELVMQSTQSCEVDPQRLKEGESITKNMDHLQCCVEVFLKDIFNSVEVCPSTIRQLCNDLREETKKRYPDYCTIGVAGFIFLRFFNPTLVSPDKLFSFTIPPDKRRNLVLITKVIQNLANGVQFGSKEPFLQPMNQLIEKETPAIHKFLGSVSQAPTIAADTFSGRNSLVISSGELVNAVVYLYQQAFYDQSKIKEVLSQGSPTISQETALQDLGFVLSDLGEPPLIDQPKSVEIVVPVEKDETYDEYLKKAQKTDFSDMAQLGAIYKSGLDELGRPIVIIWAQKLLVKGIDMEKMFLYILSLMDPVVNDDYVLIYMHQAVDAENLPTFAWLRNAYTIFNRKYKKNLKQLYIVKPTRWLKFSVALFRPFISTKFWKKLIYVDDSQQLSSLFSNKLVLHAN